MVAIRSFLVLPSVVGVVSAGLCKPQSSITTAASQTSILTTLSAAPTTESSTIFLSESTVEETAVSMTILSETTETAATETIEATTTAGESTTDIIFDATSTGAAESTLTTLATSLATSSETTTSESATTTTAAADPVATCPSSTTQCVRTMQIMCGTLFAGLADSIRADTLDDCVQLCAGDTNCAVFTYGETTNSCFKGRINGHGLYDVEGYTSGVKGSC
ncbi:hypothetical protein NXS19_000149 [Fusarium pseudograminearum]|nr:hypothetical protein NXS19_000149 [Fusarium pseudograminearum]